VRYSPKRFGPVASVFLLLFLVGIDANADSPVTAFDLTCEHSQNPIGIGVRQPRLSWKLRSERTGEVQTAYEVRAASSRAGLKQEQADLWGSGKVISDQSVLVPWDGKALGSRSRVFWQVRVWDKDGKPSAWSDIASFELGLLDPTVEWKGKWVTADLSRYDIMQSRLANASWISAGSTANQSAAVRVVVDIPTNVVVRSASVDAAADGLITIYVNGQATRQGPSSRSAPLLADARTQFSPGRNVVAIGSANVRVAIRRDRSEAGRNAIAARVAVELEDGRRIELSTDDSWRAAVSPDGEWFKPGFDDAAWPTATVLGPYNAQPSRYVDTTMGPGRYLRKRFSAKGSISKARLYATALGVYETSINGQRVSDTCFDPGWSDYNKRVMVQTCDVTHLVRRGENAIGAILHDGWYAGRVGWMGLAQYGARPVFSAQLELTYADGSIETIATDGSWQTGAGEIVGSDMQWGEVIDARKSETAWKNAVVEEHSVTLVPQIGPPVRKLLELSPRNITRRGDKWIVDFGQNFVGCIRLCARGPAGTTITVRHAEMLNPDGSFYTENIRTALATDAFILKGKGRETFEPRFTFHGFRYVEVTGYPGKLTANDLRGVVIGSDTPQVGSWECSDTNLNRLYQNIVWGQRGNFLSVPTDCPQRDERMGWMGDALVFAPTAARNTDVAGFFAKWMVDVNDAQGTNGDFPNYAPRVAQPQPGWPVWGDAGVMVPWTMFTAYGDKAFLKDNYSNMVRWIEFNVRRSSELILTGGVGDHLAPRRTPVDVVDTAYFANSARIIASAARLLDKTEDAVKYEKLHADIVEAFNKAFVSTDGTIKGDTQTAYILALQFDLLPESLRAEAARRLADNVGTNGSLTTGFVGVGLICPALTQIGRSDLAWRLVVNDKYPSWLFSVKNGATTIWERWDGWTPERGFQDPAMNSFNHYSFGSVGEWLYSGAAGIQVDETKPGYKHFFLRPQITSRLNYVKASLNSPYGIISSHWHVKGDRLLYDVTVPPNTTATLDLQGLPSRLLPAGKHHFSAVKPKDK
jgi:alpha-L-rhamnosidase